MLVVNKFTNLKPIDYSNLTEVSIDDICRVCNLPKKKDEVILNIKSSRPFNIDDLTFSGNSVLLNGVTIDSSMISINEYVEDYYESITIDVIEELKFIKNKEYSLYYTLLFFILYLV